MSVLAELEIPLSEAAKLATPRRGVSTTGATLRRWIINGVQTPDGIVRLEGRRLGAQFVTTRLAVLDFLAAIGRKPLACSNEVAV